MNQTLPNRDSLTAAAGALVLAFCLPGPAAPLAAQTSAPASPAKSPVAKSPVAKSPVAKSPVAKSPVAGDSTQTPPDAADPERVLDAALQQTASQPSIYAKLRHRVSLYGHELLGSGEYWQQGRGEQLRMRMELKMPLGETIASMTQVCDGRHLWLRRAFGEDQSQLRRVDLRKLRQAAGPDWAPDWRQLTAGGLPRLLASVKTQYRFSAPVPANYGQLPVWKLRGQQAEAAKDVPGNQRPTHVELVISRDRLTFPYRITYLTSSQRDDRPTLAPLVAMELYDVRLGVPIDGTRFEYQAENYEDATAEFAKGL